MINKFDANKVNSVEIENYLNESLKIAKFQTSIINEIKDTLQLWYPGNNFIEIDLKLDSKNNLAYVKVDGNRQITMYKIDGRDVAVIIEDVSEKIN